MRKLPRELTDAMVINDPNVMNRIHGRASMPNISTPPNIASVILVHTLRPGLTAVKVEWLKAKLS